MEKKIAIKTYRFRKEKNPGGGVPPPLRRKVQRSNVNSISLQSSDNQVNISFLKVKGSILIEGMSKSGLHATRGSRKEVGGFFQITVDGSPKKL